MKFSYSQIEECCNEMHVVANRMKEILEEITSFSNNLQGKGLWEGETSAYYSAKIKKLMSNFDEVYREMEMAILFLANSSEGYQAIEKNIMGEICNNLNLIEPSYGGSKVFKEV